MLQGKYFTCIAVNYIKRRNIVYTMKFFKNYSKLTRQYL